MTNCLDISNKELNTCSSGLKPDLSIEIYVHNLMFLARLRRSFGHMELSFVNNRKGCLSIIKLYFVHYKPIDTGEIDF
jgi:hypothetical protein